MSENVKPESLRDAIVCDLLPDIEALIDTGEYGPGFRWKKDAHDRKPADIIAEFIAARLAAPAAPGIREAAEEREACYALIRSELDATEAALKNATGAFWQECLVARKVLRHVAEKIAALRAPDAGDERAK